MRIVFRYKDGQMRKGLEERMDAMKREDYFKEEKHTQKHMKTHRQTQ